MHLQFALLARPVFVPKKAVTDRGKTIHYTIGGNFTDDKSVVVLDKGETYFVSPGLIGSEECIVVTETSRSRKPKNHMIFAGHEADFFQLHDFDSDWPQRQRDLMS